MGRKESRNQTIKFIAGIFGLLTFFCLFFGPWETDYCMAADREEAEYEDGFVGLEFSFLLQGENTATVRAGRDFCVNVAISAEGTVFSGKVNVLMLNEEENHVCYSEEILELASGESRTVTMLLPMNLKTDGLYLTLTGENDEVIIERTIPLNVVNYGNYLLIGVCAGDFSKYDYFSSFGNSLISMERADFSYGAGALDALDIILAEEEWLENAGEEEIACLQEWIRQGRLLVIGSKAEAGQDRVTLNLGLQENSLLQEVISGISSYESERNSILAENEEWRKQHGDQARECYVGDSMIGPVLVNTLSDEAVKLPVQEPETREPVWWNNENEEAEVVWQEGGRTIVAKYPFGRGNILLFSIPLAAEYRSIYPLFYYRIVQLVQNNLTSEYKYQLNSERYGSDRSVNSYLLSYFGQEGERVRVAPYLVVLAIYIGVLLPAIFLLLRKGGKSKYLWGVIPALSFLMVFLVYGMGRNTRIEAAYCSYLNVIDYTGETGQGVLNFELSAPTNKGTEITLSSKAQVRLEETNFISYNPMWDSVTAQPENVLKAREYRAAIMKTEAETVLELNNIAAFSKTEFQVSYEAEQAGDFESNVTVTEECLAGSISNRTGISYQAVYVYGSNYMLTVDGLADQETAELQNCIQISIADQEDWYNEGLVAKIFGQYPFSGDSAVLLSLIYDYIWVRNGEGNYVFAVPAKDSGLNPLGEVAENPHSQGIEVLIYFIETEEAEFEEEVTEEAETIAEEKMIEFQELTEIESAPELREE